MNNKYKYALVDMSYLLYRNIFAVSRGKQPGEYTEGDVIRCTLQTLNKLSKTWGITCDKIIMIYDKWDPQLGGYYTTHLLKGAYKDSRGDIEEAKGKADPLNTYMTKEKFEALKADPNTTEDILKKAEEKLYFNDVKYRAKWGMVKDLKNFGVPSVGVDGWEFDNLAWLASGLLYGMEDKPSIIITKDTDLQYSLTPKMDYFKLPTKGSSPEIITYQDMYNTIPDVLRDKLSLYEYKSYLDSIGEGHNGMRKTRKARTNPTEVIQEVLKGDYSNISDIDLFNRQLESFDLSKFPRLNEAKRIVTELFSVTGRLGTLNEFNEFRKRYGMKENDYLGDDFFISFISKFNPDFYK